MKPTACNSGEERHMKTTTLLLAGAALVLGLSPGLARSQEVNRCDVSNPDGSCREAANTSADQAASAAGAGSGEPDDQSGSSNMAPGNDGTAGGP
jgi:hypothetical protein